MKVEIVRNPTGKKKQVETIDFNGNTIYPYYLNLLSMEHHPDKLVFHILGEYKTKFSYDEKGDKLWIIGDKLSDKNTINRFEGITD